MVIIRNCQRKVAVHLPQLTHDATAVLEKLRYADFDLAIILVSESTMRQYNNFYRGNDEPTDILSFPVHEIKPGKKIKVTFEDEKMLGDLIISPAYIVRHLPHYEVSFEQRLRMLLVHGIYHLLGYDHIADEDYLLMQRRETRMIRYLNKLSPLS